jgi:hypothetical protein
MAPLSTDPALGGQQQHLANNAADVPAQLGTRFEILAPATGYPVVAKLFDYITRGSKIGDAMCSDKICEVAKDGNSMSNAVLSVFLGVHPLDVLFDLWS